MRSVGIRRWQLEAGNRRERELDVCLLHLGLGALQLVLLAGADRQRNEGCEESRAQRGSVRHGWGHNMVTGVTQVAVAALAVTLACSTGCDSPARVKPWRHAP